MLSLLKKIFSPSSRAKMTSKYTEQTYLPPAFVDGDRLARMHTVFPSIDAFYQAYAEKNHIPGYAFGVVVDGKLVYSGSGGYADRGKKIPATPQTLFRIASMTKSFTAMAIVKLRDAGKLQLDDPVAFYIPEIKYQHLTQDAPAMTIRDLLIHAAGLPQDDPWGDRKLHETEAELLGFLNERLSFANVPGVTYEYSNLAYALLGHIIQKVAGMSYQQFIANTIWQPLGMTKAAWEFTKVPAMELARGYKWLDHDWVEEPLLHDGTFGAMGGMIASVESFSQYVALHQSAWPARDDMDNGPLKRSSLREMHQPWRFNALVPRYLNRDGSETMKTTAYGYGLSWTRDDEHRVFVGHSGGLPGFGSNWAFMPEYGIGVIFLANVTYAPAHIANQEVFRMLVKNAELKPRELLPSPVLKERQQALVKLLPDWKSAVESDIFADNFFLDNAIEILRKETQEIFSKAGKIIRVGSLVPENQLRGYFIMHGERENIRISFTLTPESRPMIQQCCITL
jgi:CubicO group peptidase (beta-lactamase class C family)